MQGSLVNRILENSASDVPTVGMGATACLYTDRNAYTVIEVKSKSRIVVQRDTAIRTDKNGAYTECQEYRFEPNPNGNKVELIKTKNGWKEYKGSVRYKVGVRCEYYDYSF